METQISELLLMLSACLADEGRCRELADSALLREQVANSVALLALAVDTTLQERNAVAISPN